MSSVAWSDCRPSWLQTILVGALALTLAITLPAAPEPGGTGAYATGQYRNLFHEYLGKSESEIDAKLQSAWQQLFAGDPNSERLFYEVPGDMAYLPDINNNDVRTEGLSYGMMIAVQTNHQKEFNQVWRFAKHYMYYGGGPFRGYFAWHTGFDGRKLSPGPAPDGEEWFVMALFFASHRWGDGVGDLNYGAEAQAILHTMLHKDEEADRGPVTAMFNRAAKQINFTPHGEGANFSDPSYHLPAYYELWARWAAEPADRAFLTGVAATSRALFKKAAHPLTGLMPDYSEFDGHGRTAPWGAHQDFRYDAWRTLSNPALDYSWWAADPGEVEQSNRVLRFLAGFRPNIPDRFKIEGTPVSRDFNTPGLMAMAATAALVADRAVGEPFVRELWERPLPVGRLRYYDGLLTMIGLLEVSGRFQIYRPPVSPVTPRL